MWNKSKVSTIGYTLLSYGIILGVWQVLTYFFSPLIIPRIPTVVACIKEIFTTATLYEMILLTTQRLIIGLGSGVLLGTILGLLMGYNSVIRKLLFPIINIFQTVPPVSWLVLALVWFGFNGKPVIFIIVTTTAPIMAITLCEGIPTIDNSLLNMARLYQFSFKKKLLHIIIPSILPHLRSGFQIALGNGWKIAVMGEVLTANDGIGGMIKNARINVAPEYVVAWSIVTVLLFYLSDIILKICIPRKGGSPSC